MKTCDELVCSVVNRPDRRSTDENMRNFEIMRSILANLIALLHEMNSSHYTNYIDHFKIGEGSGRADLIDFVMEVFVLFKDLIEHPVFPPVSYPVVKLNLKPKFHHTQRFVIRNATSESLSVLKN